MIIKSEKDFKKELKRCYKDGSNFSSILFILMFGDNNNKIEKDLKEAYKLLKHEEKNKNSKVDKKQLYNNLVIVCNSLNKTEELRDYKEKYYRSCLNLITDTRIKIEGLKTMTEICFNKAFNLNNKLIDKEYLDEAVRYFLSYLQEVKNVNRLYLKERTIELIKETFSSDKYGYKKLYVAHIVDNRNINLVNCFVQSDYVDYYLLLKNKEIVLDYDKDLFNYLKAVSEYKFLKKDNDSALEYARYHLSSIRFIYAKEDYFSMINCVYKSGNKDAFIDIYNYYLNKFDKTNVYNVLNEHYKKYKDDKENLINCSFEILTRFIVSNKPLEGTEKSIKLAIQILEENSDNLTKEQLEKLSLFYQEGVGVKKDINKAKLYKNYNYDTKEISEDVKLLLSKIKPLNKYYKEEVDEIINKMMDGKEEDVYNAISLLAYNDRVLKDDELLIFLLNKYVPIYPTLTPFLAGCYILGRGVKKDVNKYNELREICLKNNYEYIDQIHYENLCNEAKENKTIFEYIETLEKEAKKGNKFAKYKLVYLMIENVYLAYDEEKINSYLLELEEEKYVMAYTYLSTLYVNKKDYDKAFKYAKEKAVKSGHPLIYKRLYKINIKNNFKYMNKQETFSCLLKASAYDKDGDIHFALGEHYINGDLTAKNYEKGFKYVLKSAELENQKAIRYLYSLYKDGSKDLNIKKDLDVAYTYFVKLIDENKVNKNYLFLINLYLNENSKHYNPKKGMDLLLTKYEETKDPVLAYKLFFQYKDGINIEQDNAKAEHYIKIAMENGFNHSYFAYGLFIIHNNIDSSKALEEGVRFMKKTDEDNLIPYHLALVAKYCYLTQQYKDCYHYASKAIKLDDSIGLAYHYLGVLYAEGKYVDKNRKEAMKYFEKAIENGDENSYYSLALSLYLNSPFDEKKFLEIIKLALKTDGPDEHNLYCDYLVYRKKEYKKGYEYIEEHFDKLEHSRIRGDMFYYGYYVNVDFEMAFAIYSSIKRPAPSVIYNLGFCYYYGKGVKQDKHLGIEYIKRSAEKNCQEAIDFLKEHNL